MIKKLDKTHIVDILTHRLDSIADAHEYEKCREEQEKARKFKQARAYARVLNSLGIIVIEMVTDENKKTAHNDSLVIFKKNFEPSLVRQAKFIEVWATFECTRSHDFTVHVLTDATGRYVSHRFVEGH